ncbi:unnamed protein product, partial [Closterium sp. Yama58-4]
METNRLALHADSRALEILSPSLPLFSPTIISHQMKARLAGGRFLSLIRAGFLEFSETSPPWMEETRRLEMHADSRALEILSPSLPLFSPTIISHQMKARLAGGRFLSLIRAGFLEFSETSPPWMEETRRLEMHADSRALEILSPSLPLFSPTIISHQMKARLAGGRFLSLIRAGFLEFSETSPPWMEETRRLEMHADSHALEILSPSLPLFSPTIISHQMKARLAGGRFLSLIRAGFLEFSETSPPWMEETRRLEMHADSCALEILSPSLPLFSPTIISHQMKARLAGGRFLSLMKARLAGGRFRSLNEALYTSDGDKAFQMFSEDPNAFAQYHEGYREQVASWPINPLHVIIDWIRQRPATLTVVDFGCGEAKLAASVPNKVTSLDLVAAAPGVIACNMAH